MGVISQNALSSITAINNFSPGVIYIPSLVSFGVCSGNEKCDHFGYRKKKKNNNNHYDYKRDLAGSLLRPYD